MRELSPRARAVLEATHEAYRPSQDDRERVRKALLTQLAVAATVGTLAGPALAGAATTSASSAAGATAVSASVLATTAGKIVACVAFLGVVGAGTAVGVATVQDAERPSATVEVTVSGHRQRPHHVAARAELAEAGPQAETEADPETESDPEAEPEAERRAPSAETEPRVPGPMPGARVRAARPEPSPNLAPGITAEVQLLRDAQAAMRSGDAERALSLLDDGAARLPEGVLREERTASRIVALCRLGRLDEGRAATRHFLTEWPASPLAPRVRAACPPADELEGTQ